MKNNNLTISLLHPFSAKAIGVEEQDLYYSHSKSQELALRKLQNDDFVIYIDYFTQKIFPYQKKVQNLVKRFWPVTYPLVKKRGKWRKQSSKFHEYANLCNVTIINMSGHGSPYTFNYARKLKLKDMPYIAMIGGVNMSFTSQAIEYYKNANHILVHTHLQRKELKKNKYFENFDIRVLPLGIDTEIFKPVISISKSHSFKLLFVGRISRLKRIEIALKTVHFLKKKNCLVKLDILGFVSDSNYKKELLQLAEELNIVDQVNFLGAKKQEDLVGFYRDADILLLPSEHESFGMVMVEAMGCGCAAAAIEGSGGPEEIIKNEVNGLITSIDSYSEKIYELLQDEVRLNEMKKEAIKIVKANFSISTTYQVLKQSVKDCLEINV